MTRIIFSLALVSCGQPNPVPEESPDGIEVYSLEGDPPPIPVGAEHGVEILSLRGEPPPLELSKEAKGYLRKYGGWLTWKPDAPDGGQWTWEPKFADCGKFMQSDQVADITVILAGVNLEAHCRLCATRRRGMWSWEGCSCEAMEKLETIYVETENRLQRDGITDRMPVGPDPECEG